MDQVFEGCLVSPLACVSRFFVFTRQPWLKYTIYYRDNIEPACARRSEHKFLFQTFEKPTICNYCSKFLKGRFFQVSQFFDTVFASACLFKRNFKIQFSRRVINVQCVASQSIKNVSWIPVGVGVVVLPTFHQGLLSSWPYLEVQLVRLPLLPQRWVAIYSFIRGLRASRRSCKKCLAGTGLKLRVLF